ncbi:MAG: hypothetical protein M3Z32_11075, partial [Acidobacteriota bacterium]|nr:hypothetical protein [Acidobacteriota bacterium]
YPDSTPHGEAHRVIADVYRGWAPLGMFIGHFSIKKEGNIYGLIFGSQHWRGMQKFLDVAWTLDAECGEANYEMEADTIQGEIDFESGRTGFKKRKVKIFQEELLNAINVGTLATDQAVFLYCLTNGFRPRVAKEVYVKLRETKVLKNLPAEWPRYSDIVMKAPRHFKIDGR